MALQTHGIYSGGWKHTAQLMMCKKTFIKCKCKNFSMWKTKKITYKNKTLEIWKLPHEGN